MLSLDDSVYEESPLLSDTVTVSGPEGRVDASGSTSVYLIDDDGESTSAVLSHPYVTINFM